MNMKSINRKTDRSLIYYGPHPCQRCDPKGKFGTLIVKGSNPESDDLEFNFVHDSHYPNHIWQKHECLMKSNHIAPSEFSSMGGKARAKKLTKEERSAIGKKGMEARQAKRNLTNPT